MDKIGQKNKGNTSCSTFDLLPYYHISISFVKINVL